MGVASRFNGRTISLKWSLGIPVFLMGLLSLILALFTGSIYRSLILSDRTEALARLVSLESDNMLAELHERAADIGLTLQHDKHFRKALRKGDESALQDLLNDQFHQYMHTTGMVQLEKVKLLDLSGRIRLETDEGHLLGRGDTCPTLLDRAMKREGSERLKPLSQLCLIQGVPFYVTLVPTGGLRLTGYLAVITKPDYNLRPVSKALGLPLRIEQSNGETLHSSADWPQADLHRHLLASHQLFTPDGEPILELTVAADMGQVEESLSHTMRMIVGIAFVLTLAMALIVLWVFRRIAIRPLEDLIAQMRRMNKDQSLLGQAVKVSGSREIATLAEDFNRMSSALAAAYRKLEGMAYTDPLTRLPNRALFYDRLEQLIRLSDRMDTRFAVFLIDLNRFKEINDTLGHAAGDQLLQAVAQRMHNCLRMSDTVAKIADDTVARLGGDEFAVALPSVSSQEEATLVAERLLAAVNQPLTLLEREVSIGMSIGMALYPMHGENCDQLIHCADLAMYEAKRSGRGHAMATDCCPES